jgi:hypothetical protein
MDDLDYEKHLSDYRGILGSESEYAEREAQKAHAFSVFNPLGDWFAKAIHIAEQLTQENAKRYMKYGAGRRLDMIFSAYRAITLTVLPDRVKPLSYDEQSSLSRDINIIYMNLRGTLDNFAWCFLYEKEARAVGSFSRMNIDLFAKKFRALPSFVKIAREISVHDDWNKEVKERRDPVAHRIPLYIPPSIVDTKEAERYKELVGEYAFEQLTNIGRFYPCFQHHPDEGIIPIYPTLPTDMTHLIRIGNIVELGLLTN